jgi:RNA polymerase sigma factor (sigma-70 family)
MSSQAYGVIRQMQRLFQEGTVSGLTEWQLLQRYVVRRDEVAFEALVARHGPMVLAVCRRLLDDPRDVEDAFQATFLVLLRRARSLREHHVLGLWLYGVVSRVALRVRSDTSHRRRRESLSLEFAAEAAAIDDDPGQRELAQVVDEECRRLPAKYSAPIVLVYLEGRTYEEAARELGWPVNTVKGRLVRARELLRSRLARRSLAPTAAGLIAALSREAKAAVPETLTKETTQAALRWFAGHATAVAVADPVHALAEGVLKTMPTISWKSVAAVLLVGGSVIAGAVSLSQQAPGAWPGGHDAPSVVAAPAPGTPIQVALLARQGKAESKSLLTNAGVEEGAGDFPKAWIKGAAVPGVAYIWSQDTAHNGKASLCLKKTAPRYFPIAEWTQKVDRDGDAARLKVSAWVKAEQAGKAILDVQFVDGGGKGSHAWAAYIGAKEAGDPPVSHDWKRYEGVVAIPAGTKKIIVAPQIYGPGTVWFDDLSAEYTADAETDPTASAPRTGGGPAEEQPAPAGKAAQNRPDEERTPYAIQMSPENVYEYSQLAIEQGKLQLKSGPVSVVPMTCDRGVTGVMLIGNGTFRFAPEGTEPIEGTFHAAMLRFNPQDQAAIVPIDAGKKTKDRGAYDMSRLLMNPVFGHCWHSGQEALLPTRGALATVLYSKEHGDLLISLTGSEAVVHNFTTRKTLYEKK